MSAQHSEIIHHNGGTMLVGPDAVNLMRAITLKSALSMYARSGMLMTRGATPKVMLAIAKEYTGKDYKGHGKYTTAAEDVGKWIDTMKAALPVTDERTKEEPCD